jgi:hypothetical protein
LTERFSGKVWIFLWNLEEKGGKIIGRIRKLSHQSIIDAGNCGRRASGENIFLEDSAEASSISLKPGRFKAREMPANGQR